MKQLLNDYRTPFIDAYEWSRRLREGELEKSRKLESVIDRLKDCPWAEDIRIKFDAGADNPDYSNHGNTITIRPQDPPERQTENFAHEAHHATRQFLFALYGGAIVGKSDFVDQFLHGEVQALRTEGQVHDELGHVGPQPRFNYFLPDGTTTFVEIGPYIQQQGTNSFLHLVRTVQPLGRNAKPYGEHYGDSYDAYKQNFNQDKLRVDGHIRQWEATGHSRTDI